MYEPSEDLSFMLTDADGYLLDAFNFYGPWSAGLELAIKRSLLTDAEELHVYSRI